MTRTFTRDFKQFFGRGLAILLPSIVTLWLLWQALAFVYSNVAEPINRGVRVVVIWVAPNFIPEDNPPDWWAVNDSQIRKQLADRGDLSDDPNEQAAEVEASRASISREIRREYLRDFWDEYWILNITGFVVAILLIYLAGLLLGNYLGKKVYGRIERLISRIPGFKQVYPHVKQVVELMLGEKKMAFSKVALIEWPRKGAWSIAFLTGESTREIDGPAGGEVMSVFVPTSPTPFTGFTTNVRRDEIIEMDMTVEQALRFVITAGVLTPEHPGTNGGLDAAQALASGTSTLPDGAPKAREADAEPGQDA